jgi:hypothetical protein
MNYAVAMGSGDMIYVYKPSFMKLGKCVDGILTFSLSNLKVCNVGIPEGRDL